MKKTKTFGLVWPHPSLRWHDHCVSFNISYFSFILKFTMIQPLPPQPQPVSMLPHGPSPGRPKSLQVGVGLVVRGDITHHPPPAGPSPRPRSPRHPPWAHSHLRALGGGGGPCHIAILGNINFLNVLEKVLAGGGGGHTERGHRKFQALWERHKKSPCYMAILGNIHFFYLIYFFISTKSFIKDIIFQVVVITSWFQDSQLFLILAYICMIFNKKKEKKDSHRQRCHSEQVKS